MRIRMTAPRAMNLREACDSVILMRNEAAVEPELKILDLQDLQEGNGYLMAAGNSVPVQGGHEDTVPPDPIINDRTKALIDRITQKVKLHSAGTHMERLELVARCCGYRSWHAAQGHRFFMRRG